MTVNNIGGTGITISLVVVLSAFYFAVTGAVAGEQYPGPNIVIVPVDALGFGDIGANGATRIRTPNIGAIGAAGVTITQFYC